MNWVFEEWGMVQNEILFSAVILPRVMMKSAPNVNEGVKVCCHCNDCKESPMESLHCSQTFRWLKPKFWRALIKSLYVMDFFFDDKTQNSAWSHHKRASLWGMAYTLDKLETVDWHNFTKLDYEKNQDYIIWLYLTWIIDIKDCSVLNEDIWRTWWW